MSTIELKFKNKAIIQPGGWAIYSKKDSVEFIKECKRESIDILGIDGFFRDKDISHPSIPNLSVTPDSIQPSMEHSIDFSSAPLKGVVKDVYAASIDFLEKQSNSMFFEIVCDDS